jgi:hypothetical protein
MIQKATSAVSQFDSGRPYIRHAHCNWKKIPPILHGEDNSTDSAPAGNHALPHLSDGSIKGRLIPSGWKARWLFEE